MSNSTFSPAVFTLLTREEIVRFANSLAAEHPTFVAFHKMQNEFDSTTKSAHFRIIYHTKQQDGYVKSRELVVFVRDGDMKYFDKMMCDFIRDIRYVNAIQHYYHTSDIPRGPKK